MVFWNALGLGRLPRLAAHIPGGLSDEMIEAVNVWRWGSWRELCIKLVVWTRNRVGAVNGLQLCLKPMQNVAPCP